MERPSLEDRVEIVEQQVEVLQDLPPRMAKAEAEIVQLRNEMNSGFSALSYAINRMHSEVMARFDGVDRRLDTVDRRLDGVDRRLDAVDKRFERLDARLDAMDGRFDAQDREIADIKQLLE